MKLTIKEIDVFYNEKKVLDNISFDVNAHEPIAIIGPNGSGKSTLLKTILRLIDFQKGHILLDSKEIKKISAKDRASFFSYVPQSQFYAPELSTYDFLETSFFHQNLSKKEIDFKIISILEQENLQEFKDVLLTELSGGERQLILLLSALLQNSHYLILDEVFSFQDITHVKKISLMLKNNIGKSIKNFILVTHDLNLCFDLCQKVLGLKKGRVLFHGDTQEMLTDKSLTQLFDTEIRIEKIVNENVERKVIY